MCFILKHLLMKYKEYKILKITKNTLRQHLYVFVPRYVCCDPLVI